MMHLFKADVPYFNDHLQCIFQYFSYLASTPGWRSGPAKAWPEIVLIEFLEMLSSLGIVVFLSSFVLFYPVFVFQDSLQ